MIKKTWFYDHWILTKGDITITCDDSELNETLKELEEMEN